MADNGYESGGRSNGINRGFQNPDRQIEQQVHRLYRDNGLDPASVSNMSKDEAGNKVNDLAKQIADLADMSVDELNRVMQAFEQLKESSSSTANYVNQTATLMTRLAQHDPSKAQAVNIMRGSDPDNKSAVGEMSGNIALQSLQLQRKMSQSLFNIDRNLATIAGRLGVLNGTMEDIDKGNDVRDQQNQQEQIDEFESLRHTIAHGLINSPTATKLGQLGASLMSLGLMKVAANEHIPSWIRKIAMSAVYLQVPQTLMNIIGQVVSLQLSNWLTNGAGRIIGTTLGNIGKGAMSMLGNFMSGIGGLITKLIPIAVPLIAGALIVGGVFSLIKGMVDHHKKMKENDARIDADPNLTRGQKEMKKIGAHTKSGAQVGAKSGALVGAGVGALKGAAIGTVLGGPVGTAIGAAVGGIGGALVGALGGGALGGAIAGIGQGIKSLFGGLKTLGANMLKGLFSLGGHIVNGAKWAVANKDKIIETLKPIGQFIRTLFEMSSPFFLLFRMFAQKIMNSKLLQTVLGQTDNGGTADADVNTPGGKIKSAIVSAKNYATVGLGLGGTVKMKDLGLKGKIDSGNSVPATLKKNAYNVQQLDHILASWGYDVTYTSNMGGKHQTGEKSHASGNKVDLQLMRGGKVDKLSTEQLEYLRKLGYWGGNTGALGWEAVAGQVGGGHYDLHIGNQVKADTSDQQLVALRKKAEDAANEEKRKKEEEAKRIAEEKRKKEDHEKWAKENPGLAKAQNVVKQAVKDITGMKDYTARENTTNKIANVGM